MRAFAHSCRRARSAQARHSRRTAWGSVTRRCSTWRSATRCARPTPLWAMAPPGSAPPPSPAPERYHPLTHSPSAKPTLHDRPLPSRRPIEQVISVDVEKRQATVQAGARVSEVVEALRPHGLTLQNYASIAEQQIGGFLQVRTACRSHAARRAPACRSRSHLRRPPPPSTALCRPPPSAAICRATGVATRYLTTCSACFRARRDRWAPTAQAQLCHLSTSKLCAWCCRHRPWGPLSCRSITTRASFTWPRRARARHRHMHPPAHGRASTESPRHGHATISNVPQHARMWHGHGIPHRRVCVLRCRHSHTCLATRMAGARTRAGGPRLAWRCDRGDVAVCAGS